MRNLLYILLLLPVLASAQTIKITDIEAQYPIDNPSMANLEDGIIGRWKWAEDAVDKDNFYEIIRKSPYALDKYHIKYWDRGGTNPSLESNLHITKIGSTMFINMPYFERGFTHQGYFFLKVLQVNADFTQITATIVNDTTLWNLSQAEVKERITKNVNNPAYFSNTIHLIKMN